MARDRKFGQRKNTKCPICGHTFKAQKYLKQHIGTHNNNNNNKINKNKLKEFIKFIIKIIYIINEKIEVLNYVGDREEQKKKMYYLENNIPDTTFAKKIINIEDESNYIDNDEIEERAKDNLELYNKTNIKKNENKNENENKNKEYENYMEIINYISKFNKKNKKLNYLNIKIKPNAIKKLKEEYKKIIVGIVEEKLEEQVKMDGKEINIDNRIKLTSHEYPIIEYEADFKYPKISARQVFKQTINDKKIINFIMNYINKNYDDYPTDEEIKNEFPLAYDHFTKVLSCNKFYSDNFNEIQNKILEYLENGGINFKCDDCKKFVLNKKRHSLHCRNFLEKLNKEGGELKLKRYIEQNYKKINLEEVDIIVNYFKGKNPEEIAKELPNYIKRRRRIRKSFLKKLNKKKINEENDILKSSEMPPVQFNTGLAKKLFKEITKFKLTKLK